MECEYDDCEQDKVHIQQSFIGENYIKQEPYDTSDPIENNTLRLAEIINCRSNIKLEDEEESITNNTETCIIDDKVIVQETIFLNDFKKESNETNRDLCCEKCNEEYELYCTKCSMLVRLLDSCVKNDIDSKAKKTLPKDILEIKNVFSDMRVYALKVIPEGTIFGPFEGLDSVPSTTGSTWRLKGGKLIYRENSEQRVNWMQYVNYVPHSSDQNLLVFQYQDRLYYRSTQKIDEGKELLVYYCQEQGNNLEDDESEMYLHPIVARDFKNVYACTYCCLGYGLEEDLLKHKTKCCSRINTEVPVEGIVQCPLCKIYMEKTEHSEYHIQYCWDKNSSESNPTATADQEVTTSLSKQLKSTHKASRIRQKKLAKNLSQCDLCDEIFTQMGDLEEHLRIAHPPNTPFKCSKCPYETPYKTALDKHLDTHADIKQFECEICQKRFRLKSTLKRHIMRYHADMKRPKRFKCVKCPYESDSKKSLVKHHNTHSEEKPFNCEVCFRGFTSSVRLRAHVKRIHPEDNVKKYKCHVCGYETGNKSRLKQHFRCVHGDRSKFKCEHCEKVFNQKANLKYHIKTMHGNDKEFKCAKCRYETNRKDSYLKHTLTHDSGMRFTCRICNIDFACRADVKAHDQEAHSSVSLSDMHNQTEHVKRFECKTCLKQFHQKADLIKHIKNTHGEKAHKCPHPHCSYKSSRVENLRRHLSVHDKIQNFDCQICNVGFANEEHLNIHIQRKHTIKVEEEDIKVIIS